MLTKKWQIRNNLISSSFIVFCHDKYIKVKNAKSIWYLKYQIPSPQKVFGKVFKYPGINLYLVFYLNTSVWVFDQHCKNTAKHACDSRTDRQRQTDGQTELRTQDRTSIAASRGDYQNLSRITIVIVEYKVEHFS